MAVCSLAHGLGMLMGKDGQNGLERVSSEPASPRKSQVCVAALSLCRSGTAGAVRPLDEAPRVLKVIKVPASRCAQAARQACACTGPAAAGRGAAGGGSRKRQNEHLTHFGEKKRSQAMLQGVPRGRGAGGCGWEGAGTQPGCCKSAASTTSPTSVLLIQWPMLQQINPGQVCKCCIAGSQNTNMP